MKNIEFKFLLTALVLSAAVLTGCGGNHDEPIAVNPERVNPKTLCEKDASYYTGNKECWTKDVWVTSVKGFLRTSPLQLCTKEKAEMQTNMMGIRGSLEAFHGDGPIVRQFEKDPQRYSIFLTSTGFTSQSNFFSYQNGPNSESSISTFRTIEYSTLKDSQANLTCADFGIQIVKIATSASGKIVEGEEIGTVDEDCKIAITKNSGGAFRLKIKSKLGKSTRSWNDSSLYYYSPFPGYVFIRPNPADVPNDTSATVDTICTADGMVTLTEKDEQEFRK